MRDNSKTDYWILLNEEADQQAELRANKKMRSLKQNQTRYDFQMRKMLAEELQKEENEFHMTYKAARHEQVWLSEALTPFFQDSLISDVLRLVRGGKEANVYCCQAHPAFHLAPSPFPGQEEEPHTSIASKVASLDSPGQGAGLLAAKIYRPQNRVMKDDSQYREGRVYLGDDGKGLLNHREARAIRKKTQIGKELLTTSWIEYEFQTLQLLYDAGAHVPRPVTQVGNAILMEYIGEAAAPAPILQAVTLERWEAQELFDLLMGDVQLMLAYNRIHADLSAYNVLYWEGRVTIIDFPQVVDPILNSRGYALLARDIHRLCQYFIRQGVQANASQIATDMWSRYIRGEFNKGAK